MSTITKERAQEIFLGNGSELTASEERELARIALASLKAEPVSFDELNAAVAEVTGANEHSWNLALYKGHHPVPFMNYNSLARIVDKYRTTPPASVVSELCAAIEALLDMQVRMVKQTNIGASYFDGETISAMNYAPIQAKQALELAKLYK